MNSDHAGLGRALRAGDYVILSTGAIGRVRESYPPGYSGSVSIEIDGQIMSELAGTLVLHEDRSAGNREASDVVQPASDRDSHVREPDKRMRD
jgi:hypothetical protein